jgi:NAD-dependent dihydropyrimidine dehydrogenase PreA subunit/coenzyme F420-reducing hydrogenase delta subunit
VLLARADVAVNALYTWRYNPLYHTGALVVASFVVLTVTGVYLFLFYRIGTPYDSVARITEQAWAGRWIRTLHRYVSDLAIVAIVVHAIRMFAQDRAWGPRALAWVSGSVLTVVFLICGWTGYVMVWDVQGQVLAVEGARLFDFVPIFSDPISRTFVGERDMPSAFFFLNLFAHIALPVGIAVILWIHVSRLARARLMPPRPLFWGTVGLFTAISLAWPAPMAPEADLLRLPTEVPFDVFYGFWLPFTRSVSVGWAWAGLLAVFAAVVAVPWLTRSVPEDGRSPSWVNPRFCTGCEQCYHDCPWEAIDMVSRTDAREGFVAFVNSAKCVSCGICSGSCAPMSVGPPGRTGRDQLERVKGFIEKARPSSSGVVIVGCERSAAGWGAEKVGDSVVYAVSCAGALHTSVIEYLVRAGAGGVLVVACPTRDCWNREGVVWLEARVHEKREAELQERVDRRRVRIACAAEHDALGLALELERFRGDVAALEAAAGEENVEIDALCVVPAVSVAEEVEA